MAFENCLPRVFSSESIERNAPPVSGVYGISNSQKWLFVGETDNIKASLLAHLRAPLSFRLDDDPTGFSFEPRPSYDRVGRQQRLIGELFPTCQTQSTGGRSQGSLRARRAAFRPPTI